RAWRRVRRTRLPRPGQPRDRRRLRSSRYGRRERDGERLVEVPARRVDPEVERRGAGPPDLRPELEVEDLRGGEGGDARLPRRVEGRGRHRDRTVLAGRALRGCGVARRRGGTGEGGENDEARERHAGPPSYGILI